MNTDYLALTHTQYNEHYTLQVKLGRYASSNAGPNPTDRIAIQLIDNIDGGPFGTITVNLPNEHLNDDEFFVKDYSENIPIVTRLLELGWLVPTGREVISGFVTIPVMKAGGELAVFITRKKSEEIT